MVIAFQTKKERIYSVSTEEFLCSSRILTVYFVTDLWMECEIDTIPTL